MGGCASAPKENDLPPSKSKVHHQVSQTLSPPKNISSPNLIARGNEVGKTTFLASSVVDKLSIETPTESSNSTENNPPPESIKKDIQDNKPNDTKSSLAHNYERKSSFSSPLDGTWVLNSSKEGRTVPYSPREAALYSPNQYSSHSGYSKDDNFKSPPRRSLGSGPDHLLISPIDVFPDRDIPLEEDKFLSPTLPEDENNWLQDADQDDMFLDDADEGLEEEEMNKMVGNAVQTLRNSKPHKNYNEGAVSAVLLGRIAEEREDLESNDTDVSSELHKKEVPVDNSAVTASPVATAVVVPKRRVTRGVRSRSLSWGGEQDSVSLSNTSLNSKTAAKPSPAFKNVNRRGSVEEPTSQTEHSETNLNPTKPNPLPKASDSQLTNTASEPLSTPIPVASKRIPTGRKSHTRSSSWAGDTSDLVFTSKNASSSASSTLPVSNSSISSAPSVPPHSPTLPPHSPTLPPQSPTLSTENASLPHTPPSNKMPPLPPILASPSRPAHSRLRNNSWGGGMMEDLSTPEPLTSNKVAAQASVPALSRAPENEKRSRMPQLSVSVPSRAVPKMRVRSGSWGGVMDGGALSPHLSPIPVSRTKETALEPVISPIPENEVEKTSDMIGAAKTTVHTGPQHGRRKSWGGEMNLSNDFISDPLTKGNAKSQNSAMEEGGNLDNMVSRAIVA